MEEKMSSGEAIEFLSEKLAEETAMCDAYRETAIALIDHIATEMMMTDKAERERRLEHKVKKVFMMNEGTESVN